MKRCDRGVQVQDAQAIAGASVRQAAPTPPSGMTKSLSGLTWYGLRADAVNAAFARVVKGTAPRGAAGLCSGSSPCVHLLVLVDDIARWLRHADDVGLRGESLLERREEGSRKEAHLLEALAKKAVSWFVAIFQARAEQATEVVR